MSQIEKRKAEIKAMCEFDEKAAISAAFSTGQPSVDFTDGCRFGAHLEHAKTQNLASQLLSAIEALEFYANPDNWNHGIAYSQNNLITEDDMYCVKGDHFYAGKRARTMLSKLAKGAENEKAD